MTLGTGSKRRRAGGLTLIEILVSIAILAGAMAVMLQAFARSASTLALAKNRLRAYHFCMTKMSELAADPARAVPEGGDGSFRVGRDRFTWQLESSLLPDDPMLAVVTLTTAWTHSGRPHAMQVSRLWPMPEAED